MVRNTLRRIIPATIVESTFVRQQTMAFRCRAARLSRALFPRPHPPERELRLHLGCGNVDLPGFVNVDAMPLRHVHYVQAIDDLSRFDSGSTALIYACHCLEHFDMRSVPRVLEEWHRVLAPGGILRLSVPDFQKIIHVYRETAEGIASVWDVLLGGQDNPYNFHKAVFDEKFLTRQLLQSGFRQVRAWAPEEVFGASSFDWSSRPIEAEGREFLISLNLEAVK